MSRSVLIVGASGPLGRAITSELEAHAHEVLGVSRSGERRLDFSDLTAARTLLEGTRPEAVVHLARPDEGKADEEHLVAFATLCAELAVERFVFASSSAVYGTHEPAPHSEDDDAESPAPYAQLKRRSESAIAAVSATTGLSVTSLRIFNVWGPGFDNSLVNRLALGDEPTVYMANQFVRDYIHSSDVARAFRLAVGTERAGNLVLNVGTGIGTSNPALLATFPDASYRALPGDAVRSFSVADVARIRGLWGFESAVALTDAIMHPELVE